MASITWPPRIKQHMPGLRSRFSGCYVADTDSNVYLAPDLADTQGRASDAEQVEYLERLRAIAGAQPHRFTGTAV